MAGYGNWSEYPDDQNYDGYNNYEHRGYSDRQEPYDAEHYERPYEYEVPESVKEFVSNLRKAIVEKKIFEIQNLYENTFVRLSEQYYKSSPWPDLEEVLQYIQYDVIVQILYKELYYRHIYARVPKGPTIDHRFESYFNYCSLFNYILNAEQPASLELPNQWLWEIIDEFIYQFQSFSQYRSKVGKKTEQEIRILRESPKIWNVHSVLNVLHSLVDKSNINPQLEVFSSGGNADSVAGDFGRHALYKMLGYFSLVGLLRLHSLLGDYYQAIKVLENIELNKKSLYSRVPACQITTYYYVGFDYMMMRRYADAIRTFSNVLLYIQRTKQMFQMRTYQNDQINKQTEQMYTLLTICIVLHPQRIDESVYLQLCEKYSEKMARLQRGDLQEFESSFCFSCPKFLSPVPPDYDTMKNDCHLEPMLLQVQVFKDEVRQQIMIPTIRSYLKLYTTMPISKLAAFLEMNEENFKTCLLCFKHKMKNIVWTKGTSGLEGEFQSGSEVDFYIDKDMIHIADTTVARRYGDYFIRQIHKFEELNQSLKKLNM